MKRYIRSNTIPNEITNEYLNELFKKIDWDDVDYADRLIDRIIKKELGVERIFDQAKYINMLDEGIKNDLIFLLSDPEAVHAKRMEGRSKKSSKSKSSKNTILYVKYEDYPDGNVKEAEIEGTDITDALTKLVGSLLVYLDTDQIADDNMTSDDIIHELGLRNGDGCDYIIELVNKSTGDTLMEYEYEESEDWDE